MSAGPPLCTIWGSSGLVAILARSRPVRTAFKSLFVSFSAKKDWLYPRLLSLVHPSVFPLSRGRPDEPDPGQSGVVTCMTKPSPVSFQATMPLECAHGPGQLSFGSVHDESICGSP